MSTNQIEDAPWNKIVIDQTNLFIKYVFTSNSYNIKISDLVFIYEETLDEAAIQERFCALNPYAEMNSKRILDNIKLCLEQNISSNKPDDSSMTIATKTDHNINFKLKFIVAHISLFWEFNMLCLHPNQIFIHVVQPMMYIAKDRDKRCMDLIRLIQEKDKEIEEHRAGGSKALKETEIFNKEEFFAKDIGSRFEFDTNMKNLIAIYEDLYKVMLEQKKLADKIPKDESVATDCKREKDDVTVKDEYSPVPLKKIKSDDSENLDENDTASEKLCFSSIWQM